MYYNLPRKENIPSKMTEPEQIDYEEPDIEGPKRLFELRDRLMPYQREIMLTGMIILIALVVFLGFARGGLEVCNSVGGYFNWKLECHPQSLNWTKGIDNCYDDVGQRFIVPKFEDIKEDIKYELG